MPIASTLLATIDLTVHMLSGYLVWGLWWPLNKALAPAFGYPHWSQQSSYLML